MESSVPPSTIVRVLLRSLLCFSVGLFGLPEALGAPVRFVLSVGNNLGLPGEEPLRYAEDDAGRMADLMAELGNTERGNIVLLRGADRAEVLSAIKSMKSIMAEAASRGQRVELLFYYAGHGDKENLHLGGQNLKLTVLSEQLEELPAALRLLIIDSCQGTGASRLRGVAPAEAFQIVIDQRPKGSVVITSASPGEPAQESDELGAAVFSHYLMSGLRGGADINGNGQITLHEAYQFAHSRTLLRTASSRGTLQHPGFDLEMEGSGDLVLTWPHQASARLIFPAEDGARYLIYSLPSLSVLAEVQTTTERQTVLAVPSGRFLVQRRQGAQGSERTLALPWGGQHEIIPGRFVSIEGPELARRGPPAQPWFIRLSLGYRSEPWASTTATWAHGAALAVAWERDHLGLQLHLSWTQAPLQTIRHSGDEQQLTLRPTVNYLLSGSWWTARCGGGVVIKPGWQHLLRDDAERLSAAGFETQSVYWTTALGAQGLIGLSIHVYSSLRLEGELSAGARLAALRDDDGALSVGIFPDLGATIGLGFLF